MAPILEIKNVTKTCRGGVLAVDHVTLAAEEGEFLTIPGPSGCGKTTTLGMLGGFEFPSEEWIVQAGAPAELYDRPQTSDVANCLGTSNMVAGIVTEAADGTDVTLGFDPANVILFANARDAWPDADG